MKNLNTEKWFSDFNASFCGIKCKAGKRLVSKEYGLSLLGVFLADVKKKGRNVWWVGNGGSESVCAHLSQDVLNKLKIRSLMFSDPSLATCMSNDYGYEEVYLKPLSILANNGDLLIAISSSGNSLNIVKCADFALKNHLRLAAFCGFSASNLLWKLNADLSFFVPSRLYGHVEIAHEMLLHSVIEAMQISQPDISR